jgi:hypothetical protein
MKVLFSMLLLAGLVYGAYVVNDKFLSGPKAASKPEPPLVAAEQMLAQPWSTTLQRTIRQIHPSESELF